MRYTVRIKQSWFDSNYHHHHHHHHQLPSFVTLFPKILQFQDFPSPTIIWLLKGAQCFIASFTGDWRYTLTNISWNICVKYKLCTLSTVRSLSNSSSSHLGNGSEYSLEILTRQETFFTVTLSLSLFFREVKNWYNCPSGHHSTTPPLMVWED